MLAFILKFIIIYYHDNIFGSRTQTCTRLRFLRGGKIARYGGGLKEGPARKHEAMGKRKEGARDSREEAADAAENEKNEESEASEASERASECKRACTWWHVERRGSWEGPAHQTAAIHLAHTVPLSPTLFSRPFATLLCSPLPLCRRAFTPAYGAAARVSRRVLPRVCASCILGPELRSVMRSPLTRSRVEMFDGQAFETFR